MDDERLCITEEEARHVIRLTGSTTLDLAERLHQEALRLAGTGKGVAVDLSQSEHVDACTLQVLVALRAELARQGRGLEVAVGCDPLPAWVELSGLRSLLLPGSGAPPVGPHP